MHRTTFLELKVIIDIRTCKSIKTLLLKGRLCICELYVYSSSSDHCMSLQRHPRYSPALTMFGQGNLVGGGE